MQRMLVLALLLAAACDGAKPKAPSGPPDTGTKTSTKTSEKRGQELPEVTWRDGPIARVNGVEIPRKSFDIYYNRFRLSMHKNPILFPVGGAEAVQSRVAKRLVAEEVIRQEAKRQKITPPEEMVKERMEEMHARLKRDPMFAEMHRELGTTDEIWRAEAEVDAVREVLVDRALRDAVKVPDAELKKEYQARIAQFRHPEQIHLQRIRFDIGQGMSGDQVKELRKRAEAVRALIAGKKYTFEKAANEYSAGSSKDKGGDIGWLGRQALPDAISNVLWALKPNTLSEVLEDDRGVYIFKVLGFRKEGVQPLDEVRALLIMDLRRKRQDAAVAKLMDDWRSNAKIEILVPELSEAMTRTSTVMPEIPEGPPREELQLPNHRQKLE